ncbi:MAG: CRISPR-associated endonuclease Cas1, partial [Nitrospinota bacterium]
MSTVYILTDHGTLKKKGEKLILDKDGAVLNTIFPYKTEQLMIIGNVEITSPALKSLMKHQIDTVFLGRNGRFNGKIAFQAGKNVFLRQAQFKLLEDSGFKLKISKEIVSGKLRNQLSFMQRITRSRKIKEELKGALENMKRALRQVDEIDNVDSLRGVEGLGARYFFSVFRHSIIQDWAVFNGRSMHPPKDNVNAVLSFLYTMMLFRVDAAIESFGLDSYAGYFHSLDYGKRSLSYDLVEEYRTPIADTLTASLFNLGVLSSGDFEEITFKEDSDEYPLAADSETEGVVSGAKKGVLLTKDGLKKVITQF